ncbi:hypothetical protein ACOSQ4_013717 [Xanthoceras sorbifolium]
MDLQTKTFINHNVKTIKEPKNKNPTSSIKKKKNQLLNFEIIPSTCIELQNLSLMTSHPSHTHCAQPYTKPTTGKTTIQQLLIVERVIYKFFPQQRGIRHL